MARIEKETAPVEVIGVSIKRSEIQEQVGIGLNKTVVDMANGIIGSGIKDAAGKRVCAELILRMKKRLDDIKKAKDMVLKKIKAAVKDAEEPFNNAYNEIAALKTKLNDIYLEYDDQEKRRMEAEERQRRQEEVDRAAERERIRMQEQMENDDADIMAPAETPTQTAVPAAPRPAASPVQVSIKSGPTRVQGAGTLSVIETTKPRIVDPALVPAEYKVPSDRLLMEAYDAGITSIPGVEFYKERSTRSLTAK
jgi:hypothetical protein